MNQIIKELRDENEHGYCYVEIQMYLVGHSMMFLQVDRGKKYKRNRFFFLTFLDVLFFEGPLRWQGIDFYVGESNTYEKIMKQIGINSILFNKYNLYRVEDVEGYQIKIIAAKIKRSSDIPEEFARIYSR